MSSDNSNTTNTSISQPSCPVDHKARAAWLDQAKLHGADNDNNPTANISRDTFSSASKTQSCDSSTIDQTLSPNTSTPTPTSSNPAPNPAQPSSPLKSAFDYLPIPFLQRKNRHPPVSTPETLDTERQVSSIPRATITSSPSPSLSPLTRSSQNTSNGGETTNYTSSSSNNTNPTNISGHLNRESPTEGNWIYPSERMFFDAMRRKSHDPRAEDMRAIVPIHNAVNERAWSEIRAWERGRGAERCGGPRLLSFRGDASALTPRARLNTWLGYQPPFDRHDWVVDRCGTSVEYVIDFYQGRDGSGSNSNSSDGNGGGGNTRNNGRRAMLSFYLDVRPKLNSWEGWRMRAGRMLGL